MYNRFIMNIMNNKWNLFLIGIVVIFTASCDSNSETSNQVDQEVTGLIQHNVYFYLIDDISDEEREDFDNRLQELVQISTIMKSNIGRPAATQSRDVTDHDFTISLTLWFESLEDHDSYQIDPVHTAMVEATGHLLEGVRVYDSQILYEN